MKYRGQGNPLGVLIACLVLGYIPLIALVLFICWIPLWLWATLIGCFGLAVIYEQVTKPKKESEENHNQSHQGGHNVE